jgi:hypothetical protein
MHKLLDVGTLVPQRKLLLPSRSINTKLIHGKRLRAPVPRSFLSSATDALLSLGFLALALYPLDSLLLTVRGTQSITTGHCRGRGGSERLESVRRCCRCCIALVALHIRAPSYFTFSWLPFFLWSFGSLY